VLSAASLSDGIKVAFRVDVVLALVGTVVSLWLVHGATASTAHSGSPHAHHRLLF
jgi:hypothetical protein